MSSQGDIVASANANHYSRPGAFLYTESAYHKKRILVASRLLKSRLPARLSGLTLVDIGPGATSPLDAFTDPAVRRIAVDSSTAALACLDRFTERICADVSQGLPLASSSVDAIYSGELIEHLFDSQFFLSECHRVLKPGGLIVITTPNIATLQDRLRFLFGYAPRHIDPLHPYIRLHIRPFTPELLVRALRAANLDVECIRSNFLDFHIAGRRYNIPVIATVLPKLGGTIIALGRRT